MVLIFVKVPNGPAVSVDVELSDAIQTVKEKVQDRLGTSLQSFTLAFAGKRLEGGSLADYGIKKESTLHCIATQSITVTVAVEGKIQEMKIPNDDTVTIREVRLLIKNAFPIETSDWQYIEVIHSGSALASARTVKSCGICSGDTLVAVKISPNNNNNEPKEDIVLDEETKADFLSSFAKGAKSSKVEIVFSFDTTGSMNSIIAEVRKKIKQTATRLLKDIPDIRIGIIAHGDYCDSNIYVVTKLDLTNDVDSICDFVDGVRKTNGGGGPAVYELVLRKTRFMSWQDDSTKALVVIGDEVPRAPSYTTEKINWWDELECLVNLGIKVYGIQALNKPRSIPFYKEISARSGAVSINFSSFTLIVDMFLAICYREASPTKLKEFQEEVENREEKMSEEMGEIFETLAKPNPIIPDETKENRTKINEPWYNTIIDVAEPVFTIDEKSGKWTRIKPLQSLQSLFSPSSPSSPSSTTSTTSTSTSPLNTPNPPDPLIDYIFPKNFKANMEPVKLAAVGDGAVGKTSLLITFATNVCPDVYIPTIFDAHEMPIAVGDLQTVLTLHDTAGQESYDRLRPLAYIGTSIFFVCFSVMNRPSFENIETRWVPEIQHYCPATPFFIVGLKTDLRNDVNENKRLLNSTGQKPVLPAEGKALATKLKAGGYFECSSFLKTNVKVTMDAAVAYVHEERASRLKPKGKCMIM